MNTGTTELRAEEKNIAAEFLGRTPWEAVAWGLLNPIVFLSLWPLVIFDVLPLWLGFIIATINVCVSYLPSHEAQHDIIARPGERLYWLNQLVGHWSVLPLAQSYWALRLTHMEHHKHANDPELDPDHGTSAPNAWQAIVNSIIGRQPRANGGFNKYGEILVAMNTPQSRKAILHSLVWKVAFFAVLAGAAWAGYAIEAALLWWLPRHIGLTYIQFYLSWAPHHPAQEKGRYRDTRAFRSRLGNIVSMGMQYHIIHHLYPRIPLTDTPAAYRKLRPVLEQRGCDLGGL